MRFFGFIVGGNSVETASFFVNRSLTSRMLLLGLPLLAAVLALIFFVTGGSLANLVNHAIARNTQLQTQAMSLALEQILVETRNQLLILAAGSMDRQEMARRLKFRSRADGLRYREVAFMGLTPENRYLLLNYGGEIIAVPPHVALDAPAGPFRNISPGQRPGHVNVSQPLEVVYSMVPIDKSLQSLAFYVLRFSTPIYDAAGNFQGILILSLDLNALRDTILLARGAHQCRSGNQSAQPFFRSGRLDAFPVRKPRQRFRRKSPAFRCGAGRFPRGFRPPRFQHGLSSRPGTSQLLDHGGRGAGGPLRPASSFGGGHGLE